MSEIDDALKTAWAANADLVALIPAARVFSGPQTSTVQLPFATFTVAFEAEPDLTTSGPHIARVSLDVSIRSKTKSEAMDIRRAVREWIGGQAFVLDLGADKLIALLRTTGGKLKEIDDVWNCFDSYEAMIETRA